MSDISRFVARCGRRQHTGAQPAVDGQTVRRLGNEIRVSILFQQFADAVERVIPSDPLPAVGSRSAILWILEAALAVHEVDEAGAFRAQGASIDRMIGI